MPNTGRISSKKGFGSELFFQPLSYTFSLLSKVHSSFGLHIFLSSFLLFLTEHRAFPTLQYSSKFALSMMTHEYKTPSSTDSHFAPSQPSSKWSSSIGSRDTKPSNTNTMLSINFSTPLAGAARSERIKQMTNNHVSQRVSSSFCLLFYPAQVAAHLRVNH